MRSGVIGFTVISVLLFTFITIATIQTGSNLRYEVTTGINEAIYNAEVVLYDKWKYTDDIKSNEDFAREFEANLNTWLDVESIRCDSPEIYVYGIDYEKGLIDVEVKVKYNGLIPSHDADGNLVKKEISTRRTMIIEEVEDNA